DISQAVAGAIDQAAESTGLMELPAGDSVTATARLTLRLRALRILPVMMLVSAAGLAGTTLAERATLSRGAAYLWSLFVANAQPSVPAAPARPPVVQPSSEGVARPSAPRDDEASQALKAGSKRRNRGVATQPVRKS
ncbi:MAG: hypothetical protein HYX76_10985, partial [Acidobacteria bacterium]|nr:hypothetical protein [Acidobacteriota bacterium]